MNKEARRTLITLFMHLEQMEKAGVPIMDSLATAQNDAHDRKLKRDLDLIYHEVENGKNLSEAMALFPDFFDETLIRLVDVGEKSGRLARVFGLCTQYLERIDDHARKMKGATRGPKISGAITLGLAAFAHQTALPFIVFFFIIGAAITTFLYRRVTPFRAVIDRLLLFVPRLGTLIAQHSYARFAESLSMLFDAGINLNSALETSILSVPNLAIRDSVADVVPRVRSGSSLYEAFSGALRIDRFALGMIKAGERSGNLSATLRELTSYYDKRTDEAITALQQLAEPLLTIVVGALFWFA